MMMKVVFCLLTLFIFVSSEHDIRRICDGRVRLECHYRGPGIYNGEDVNVRTMEFSRFTGGTLDMDGFPNLLHINFSVIGDSKKNCQHILNIRRQGVNGEMCMPTDQTTIDQTTIATTGTTTTARTTPRTSATSIQEPTSIPPTITQRSQTKVSGRLTSLLTSMGWVSPLSTTRPTPPTPKSTPSLPSPLGVLSTERSTTSDKVIEIVSSLGSLVGVLLIICITTASLLVKYIMKIRRLGRAVGELNFTTLPLLDASTSTPTSSPLRPTSPDTPLRPTTSEPAILTPQDSSPIAHRTRSHSVKRTLNI